MTLAWERTAAFARERATFGRPLSGHQAIRHKLADLATSVLHLPLRHLRRAAPLRRRRGAAEGGHDGQARSPSAPAFELMDDCLQIHGGAGYMREYWVERAARDARLGPDRRRQRRDHARDPRARARRCSRPRAEPGARPATRRKDASGRANLRRPLRSTGPCADTSSVARTSRPRLLARALCLLAALARPRAPHRTPRAPADRAGAPATTVACIAGARATARRTARPHGARAHRSSHSRLAAGHRPPPRALARRPAPARRRRLAPHGARQRQRLGVPGHEPDPQRSQRGTGPRSHPVPDQPRTRPRTASSRCGPNARLEAAAQGHTDEHGRRAATSNTSAPAATRR